MLIKMIVVGLHAPMDTAHTFRRIRNFDVAAFLWFQSGGLRKVAVE